MNEESILRALQAGVIAAVAASIRPILPVAYVDVKFTKPNDKKWLEVVHIPNNRIGDFWGDEKNYRGILRLILHWPNDGGGPYVALGILDSIASYFTTGRLLSDVQIYDKPDFTGTVKNGDEILLPVSIRYQSWKG